METNPQTPTRHEPQSASSSPVVARRPLRVCQVCSGHQVDDGRVFTRASMALAGAGYEVHLIAADRSNTIQYECNGVIIHPICALTSNTARMKRRSEVAKMAAALNPDIYHVHEPELLGSILSIAKYKPVIWDVHESYLNTIMDRAWIPAPAKPVLRALWDISERRLVKKCAAVFAATDLVAERYHSLHPKTFTIANFPDLSEISALAEAPTQPDTCVFTGSVSENRGLRQAVMAISVLNQRGIRMKLIIAGTSSEELIDELQELAENEQIGDLVEYKGELPRPDALRLANSCGIGIIPHLPYGNNLLAWPVKMIEYMAMGIPVVYSNLPCHESLLQGANVGLSVDPKDPVQIADALEKLSKDHSLAKQLGNAGRELAQEKLNWTAESTKMLAVYKEIAGNQS